MPNKSFSIRRSIQHRARLRLHPRGHASSSAPGLLEVQTIDGQNQSELFLVVGESLQCKGKMLPVHNRKDMLYRNKLFYTVKRMAKHGARTGEGCILLGASGPCSFLDKLLKPLPFTARQHDTENMFVGRIHLNKSGLVCVFTWWFLENDYNSTGVPE